MSISLSLCLNESDSTLSGVHRQTSSVGLKRPEAVVAQLFLWLFKDNLHWELWSHSKLVCLSVILISCESLLPEIAWVYICPWYLCVHFSSYIMWGPLYFCWCRTQLCSCALNACLSDRVQPLISRLHGSRWICMAALSYSPVTDVVSASPSEVELTFTAVAEIVLLMSQVRILQGIQPGLTKLISDQ